MITPLRNISLRLVEIAEDDTLIATYGTRIPVLQKAETMYELNWPFNQDDIIAFINT